MLGLLAMITTGNPVGMTNLENSKPENTTLWMML